ncbi:outer membrane lipoprotein carrier protein LolA [Marinobacter changyiensis]|uniref:outer membrane lipoprotein carrier protein LolA n=1 Tax=Marinobacter changyiensis TaxID=2604091 RepID=UPI0012653FEA|nr:outer membrane lipoprotein carrier protein LolA [Marinobacter changyiensis]
MKTLLRLLLMLLVVSATPAWAGDSAATVSEDHPLFNTMMPAPDARLEGYFRQQKTLEDLGATLESGGVFSFSVEQGLHWQVREPVATELRITREEIVEIQDGEEVMRMATEDQPMTRVISEIFFSMFTGDRVALETYFELTESGSADRWTLQLSPVDDTVASVMASIELQGAETVEEMILQETNGDKTRILLEDVRLSQP